MSLPGEHVQYLEADHRHVCKFDSPSHPIYQTIQRCLLRAVEDIDKDCEFCTPSIAILIVTSMMLTSLDLQISYVAKAISSLR
jgi:hypothetical protein